MNNEIISRQSIPISRQAFSHVYQQIYLAIDKLIRDIPPCPYGLIGISLAVRGIIDLDGVIRFIPKLQWHNIDIKSLLEQRYHVPVYIDNDGNLAASMESRLHPQYEELTLLRQIRLLGTVLLRPVSDRRDEPAPGDAAGGH